MAGTDGQILVTGSGDAPVVYKVSGTHDVTLLAVNAVFDGSGAAGPYLPAVEVISDAGVRVSRNVTDDAIAAGASAEVTFAPF